MKLFLDNRDYEIAAENGISKDELDDRFYNEGMSLKVALKGTNFNKKTKRHRKYEHLYQQALENGLDISYRAIYRRKRRGWSDERTVTEPLEIKGVLANE